MWRPFAGSFVEHSLDSFIVKHEKGKSAQIYTPKAGREPSPLQLSADDIVKRMDLFKKLQEKVINQRAQIKINDSLYQQKVEKKLRYKKKPKVWLMEDFKSKVRKSEGSECENDSKIKKGLTGDSNILPLPLIKRKSSH
jgi:hypothetical protein